MTNVVVCLSNLLTYPYTTRRMRANTSCIPLIRSNPFPGLDFYGQQQQTKFKFEPNTHQPEHTHETIEIEYAAKGHESELVLKQNGVPVNSFSGKNKVCPPHAYVAVRQWSTVTSTTLNKYGQYACFSLWGNWSETMTNRN